MIMEASTVNEHQSKGVVEQLELETDHVVVPWLVMHAVLMVTLFVIGSDGRTAYERFRGKPYLKESLIFEECVFHFPLDRTRGRANELEAKFLNGVYLGLRLGTTEMYIGTATGVLSERQRSSETQSQEFLSGTCLSQLWVHHGNRRQEHSDMVIEFQQQGIPLQRAVARNHHQCSRRCAAAKVKFSVHPKTTSVQVWKRRGMRLKDVKDATREAVRIARQEELKFMDNLAVLREVLVEQWWSETSAEPIGATVE